MVIMTPAPLGGYTAASLLQAPKHEPLLLTLTHGATGASVDLHKNPGESPQHLLLKGLLWALVVPHHSSATCELDLGLRYRPDVVALRGDESIVWWGECGSVKPSKLSHLASTYPHTRFSVAKWGRSDLRGYAGGLRRDLLRADRRLAARRRAPFELINFPSDANERFLDDNGVVTLTMADLQVVPLLDEERLG